MLELTQQDLKDLLFRFISDHGTEMSDEDLEEFVDDWLTENEIFDWYETEEEDDEEEMD